MYGKLATASPAAAALPFTGLPVVWVILAAFALIALGLALWRIAPRREA